MKPGGRPVKATVKRWTGTEVVTETVNAVFHCWGYRKSKNKEDKPKMAWVETVAVVETTDGGIRLVKPESIVFTDRGTDGKGQS